MKNPLHFDMNHITCAICLFQRLFFFKAISHGVLVPLSGGFKCGLLHPGPLELRLASWC